MVPARLRVRHVALVLLPLATPSCAPVDGDDLSGLDTATQAIVGGTAAHPRREIGRWGSCTATVIDGRHAITAARCGQHVDVIAGPTGATGFADLELSTDGRTWGNLGTIPVERTFSFNAGYGNGSDDVMLLRLSRDVGSSVTPATLASAAPTTGNFTLWGLGCTDRTTLAGSGVVRYLTRAVGSSTSVLCGSDWGGPRVADGASARGSIFGVASGASGVAVAWDVFGDTVRHRGRILTTISAWNTRAAEDISTYKFCVRGDGVPGRQLYGDVNADGHVDAVCHYGDTGELVVARGDSARVLAVSSTRYMSFCKDWPLLSGDFNGDRRTDLLCADPTGYQSIDFASASSATTPYGATDYIVPTTWCKANANDLHAADINGDGRTDLICLDRVSGQRVYLLAGTGGTFAGAPVTGGSGWCAGGDPLRRLHTADVTGDGRTDLVCHDARLGTLSVVRNAGGADPFGGTPVTSADLMPCNGAGQELVVADFNGDGRADLVCRDAVTKANVRMLVSLSASAPSFRASTIGLPTYNPAAATDLSLAGQLRPRTPRVAASPWPAR